VLVTLRIRDLLVIDKLELELHPGFNVLTGETGAGKSVLVGALGLLLGGRGRADLVRPGASEASVEALFDVSKSATMAERLASMGIACEGELVVRRSVQDNGRSRSYLNGRLCSLGEIAAIAPELADVTSQHESVALANPSHHLDHLDRYARLIPRRSAIAALVDELSALASEIAELEERAKSRGEREAFLAYQLDAIRELDPQPDEIEAIDAERTRLKNADRLRGASSRVARALEDDGGLCDTLGKLAGDLAQAAAIDADLAPLAAELDASWARLTDVARQARRYAERVAADPARLEALEDRLFRLERLLRQHGPTLTELLDAAERIALELDELGAAETRLPQLLDTRRMRLDEAGVVARALSSERRRAARKLSRAISSELAALGMGKARVIVDVSPLPHGDDARTFTVDGARLGRDGIDRVQFLIAPNPGLTPRPLGRIASGGELSRALLALKRALGAVEASSCGVQVFDEVDAGVGGATADRIGHAIASLARHRQVLCITHLAAIAAHGDAHFVIDKSDDGKSTVSRIERVQGKARVAELARMLTGSASARSSREAADELLRGARRARQAA
jgi:DNA repair protein RecN (Recombination protein N)